MKIKIEIPVDIDVEAWALEYGVESDEVRQDVEEHAAGMVLDYYASLGVLAEPSR